MALPNPLGEVSVLGRDDRIFVFGEYWRPVRSDSRGHWIAPVFDRSGEIFVSHYDYGVEKRHVDFTHEVDWYRPESLTSRMAERGFSLRHLPEADQNDIVFKLRWIQEFYSLLRAGAVARTVQGFTDAVAQISQKLGLSRVSISWDVSENATKKTNRGSRDNYKIPPSPATLRRYVQSLEASEYEFDSLRDQRFKSGNRNSRFSPETDYLLEQYARKYASYKKPTRRGIYKKFEIVFKRLKRRFENEGRPVDPKPTYARFCLEIAKLDKFEVDVARLGRERAGRKWRVLGIGPDVTWALERVEMDFYEVDLHVLLVEAEIWENLPLHLRAEIERSRWYLCVALDVASRCVLGMRLSRSEDSETAVETLRMCLYDKSHIGRAAGALSPWDQYGPMGNLATDMGKSFTSGYFQARGHSLLSDGFNPPAAQPQLRPFIERFFRTIKDNLLRRFEGNTGGSIQELGDYPAQLRAVLTIGQFADLLVRWCVDVYHNQQHDGLGRETPRDAWLRLTKLKKPRPRPNDRRMRETFGLDLNRRTGRPGIRIAGLFYTSEDLQAWCRANGDASVEVRIDPENIGEISVRLDPKSVKWVPLPCRTRFMRGRKLSDWLLAASELRRMYGEVAEIRLPVVLAAVEAIERAHSRAASVAQIGPGQPTAKELVEAELELGMGFSIPSDDETFEDAEQGDGEPPVRTVQPTLPTSFSAALGRSFLVGGGLASGSHSSNSPMTHPGSAAGDPAGPSPGAIRSASSRARPKPQLPVTPSKTGPRRNPWDEEN